MKKNIKKGFRKIKEGFDKFKKKLDETIRKENCPNQENIKKIKDDFKNNIKIVKNDFKKTKKKIKEDFNKDIRKVKNDFKKTKKKIRENFSRIICSRIWHFAFGGILIFLIEWILSILLTELLFIPVKISYSISLFLGLSFLYLFHKRITFQIKSPFSLGVYEKFMFVYLISYIANWILVSILISRISYILAIPLISIPLGVLNYLINRHWIFLVPKKIKKNGIKSPKRTAFSY